MLRSVEEKINAHKIFNQTIFLFFAFDLLGFAGNQTGRLLAIDRGRKRRRKGTINRKN
jgi:hypothetical protein